MCVTLTVHHVFKITHRKHVGLRPFWCLFLSTTPFIPFIFVGFNQNPNFQNHREKKRRWKLWSWERWPSTKVHPLKSHVFRFCPCFFEFPVWKLMCTSMIRRTKSWVLPSQGTRLAKAPWAKPSWGREKSCNFYFVVSVWEKYSTMTRQLLKSLTPTAETTARYWQCPIVDHIRWFFGSIVCLEMHGELQNVKGISHIW